jgi:hypothetical protein
MSGEERSRPGDVRPFGEALAPPSIVFRNGVKLGQVKGNNSGVATHRGNLSAGVFIKK